MATYNGEKFIEEQLLSICRQTRKPDEIVVSDDGSKDRTLEIVDRVSRCEDARGIDFVVLTDNPRHGYCGNFEWAITHTTGDLIFLSDQDDVWVPEKVAEMLVIFEKYPDAECVCHNATLIGKNGEPLDGVFDERFYKGWLDIPVGEGIRVEQHRYLERAVSWGGIHGMSMCITKGFAKAILPFPNGGHDQWITFCSILNNSMYYYNSALTLYRIHGLNTAGNLGQKRAFSDKIKRFCRNMTHCDGQYSVFYQRGVAMKKRLEDRGFKAHAAFATASRVAEIGEKVYAAETSGRIAGAVRLCKLFCTDMRYRRSGINAFVIELIYIIRYSKRKRLQNAGII